MLLKKCKNRKKKEQRETCIFCTTLLNCDDRCVQVLTKSMARSKFFTYSPYIFMNGASFWRMSPMRGLFSLKQERANKRMIPKQISTPRFISKDCCSVLIKCRLVTSSCKCIDSSTDANTSSCSFEEKFPKPIGKKITQFPTKAGRR